MEDDIFNLSDLSDIPQELKSELCVLTKCVFERNIIYLFEKAGRQLTIDEVVVAYFRSFGEGKNRIQLVNKLYNISRCTRPAIIGIKNKKGVYILAKYK